MPYIKPDFSEYKVSDNEKFRAKLQNSKYAQFNYFVNNARFIEESKYIIINVDRGCEYNLMKYYLDVFDKEDAEHRGVASETLSPEEEEEFEEPASTQKPPMWPPVICLNGANNPSTESKESSDVPNGLPEGLPPSELSSPREWQVVCPSCAAELKVKDGDYHRCPSCSKVFQVRKTKKAL